MCRYSLLTWRKPYCSHFYCRLTAPIVLCCVLKIPGCWHFSLNTTNEECTHRVVLHRALGYVTEKIVNAFLAGAVPIYLGAPDVCILRFVCCMFSTPEEPLTGICSFWSHVLRELPWSSIWRMRAKSGRSWRGFRCLSENAGVNPINFWILRDKNIITVNIILPCGQCVS